MIPWEEDIIIYNFVSQNITIFLRRRPYLLFQISNSIVCNQQQSSHIPINKTTLLITKMTMLMQTRILKNQEACANTLSMECMDFYHRSDSSSQIQSSTCRHPRYGRDGANYTSRAIFDCYYDPSYTTSVVVDYEPEM